MRNSILVLQVAFQHFACHSSHTSTNVVCLMLSLGYVCLDVLLQPDRVKFWPTGSSVEFCQLFEWARILLLVVMISVFCQKQNVKCHSIYLCLWFCLLLNISAMSAIWHLQCSGILLWVVLLVLGFCCYYFIFILWLAEI